MAAKKITKYEYRYYDMPLKEPILALYGDSWKRVYGEAAGQLHFHNILEIGLCNYGEGSVFLDLPDGQIVEKKYSGGEVTAIPHSVPHTTRTMSRTEPDYWEFLFIDATKYINDFFPYNHRMVWGLMLPVISTPFLIMMFRQNLRNFPHEIMEAARIDGEKEIGIFFKMYLPIMRSTYAAAAVIIFFVLQKQFAEGITGAVK